MSLQSFCLRLSDHRRPATPVRPTVAGAPCLPGGAITVLRGRVESAARWLVLGRRQLKARTSGLLPQGVHAPGGACGELHARGG